jgi:hypothetical protein
VTGGRLTKADWAETGRAAWEALKAERWAFLLQVLAVGVVFASRGPLSVGTLGVSYLLICLLLMMRRRQHIKTMAAYRHALDEWEKMVNTASGMADDLKTIGNLMCPKCRAAMGAHIVHTAARTN